MSKQEYFRKRIELMESLPVTEGDLINGITPAQRYKKLFDKF